MSQWPDTRILDLLGIELPIIQAPMAGATGAAMVIAASNAGGLGSMPAALLSTDQLREELKVIRAQTQRPINVNFSAINRPWPTNKVPGTGRICWSLITANWAWISMRRRRCPIARRLITPPAKS